MSNNTDILSRRSTGVWTIFSVCLLALALLSSASHAQQDSADNDQIDAYTRSLNELFATSKTISDQPGGDAPVVFDGEFDDPRWLQGLTVTKSDNPMLEQSCRKQAVQA
nr:hypothetical protein [Gammaproteobacteria bacterium]